MITRVPVSISMGTRGTRELLMSLLVEALHPIEDCHCWRIKNFRENLIKHVACRPPCHVAGKKEATAQRRYL